MAASQPPDQIVNYLRNQKNNLQIVNGDLIRRLEHKQQEIIGLRKLLQDVRQQSIEKDSSIQKAQLVIRKLNEHGENVMKELKRAENSEDRLQSENRILDKQNMDLKISQHTLETKEKTIQRLKSQLMKTQDQNIQMARIAGEEKERRMADQKIMNQEKTKFNQITRQFEDKLNEIQDNNKLRDDLLDQQVQRGTQLESQLGDANQRAQKYQHQFNLKQEELDQKLDHVQRENANTLRNIQTAAEIQNPIYGGPYAPTFHPRSQSAKLPHHNQADLEGTSSITHSRGAGMRGKGRATTPTSRVATVSHVSKRKNKQELYSPKSRSPKVAKSYGIKTLTPSKRGRQPGKNALNQTTFNDRAGDLFDGENFIGARGGAAGGVGDHKPKFSATEPFLKMQLEQAHQRQCELKNMIQQMARMNSEFVSARLQKLGDIQRLNRAEIQRWMMRNQELETRLYEGSLRFSELKNLNKHAIQGMRAAGAQWNEQRSVYRQNKQQLEAAINFLLLQLDNLFNSEFPQVLDRSNNSMTHLKDRIESMRDLINKRETSFKAESKIRDEELEKLKSQLNRKHSQLSQVIGDHDGDLHFLQQAVNAAGQEGGGLIPQEMLDHAKDSKSRRINQILQGVDKIANDGRNKADRIKQMERDRQDTLLSHDAERQQNQGEMRRLIGELDCRDHDLTKLKRQYEEITHSFSDLQQRMKDAVGSLQRRLQESQAKVGRLQHENDVVRVQMKDAQVLSRNREDQLRDQIRSMQDQLQTKEFQLQQEKIDNKGLNQRLQKAQKRCKDQQFNFKREKVKLLERIADLQHKIIQLEGVVRDLQSKRPPDSLNGTIGASLRISPKKRGSGANYRTPQPYAGTLSGSVSPSVRVCKPIEQEVLQLRAENRALLARINKQQSSKQNLERMLQKSENNFNDLHNTLKDQSPDRYSASPVLSNRSSSLTPVRRSHQNYGPMHRRSILNSNTQLYQSANTAASIRMASVQPPALHHPKAYYEDDSIPDLKAELRAKQKELDVLNQMYKDMKKQYNALKRIDQRPSSSQNFEKKQQFNNRGRQRMPRQQYKNNQRLNSSQDFNQRDLSAALNNIPSRDIDPQNLYQSKAALDSLIYHILRAPLNQDSLRFLKNLMRQKDENQQESLLSSQGSATLNTSSYKGNSLPMSAQTVQALKRIDRSLLLDYFTTIQHRNLASQSQELVSLLLPKANSLSDASDIKALQAEIDRKRGLNVKDLNSLLTFCKKSVQNKSDQQENRGQPQSLFQNQLGKVRGMIEHGGRNLNGGKNQILANAIQSLLNIICGAIGDLQQMARPSIGKKYSQINSSYNNIERVFMIKVDQISDLIGQRVNNNSSILNNQSQRIGDSSFGDQKKQLFVRQVYERLSGNYYLKINIHALEIYEQIMRNLTQIENKSMFRNNPNFYQIMRDPSMIEQMLLQNLDEIKMKFEEAVSREVQAYEQIDRHEKSIIAKKRNKAQLQASLISQVINKFRSEVMNVHNSLILSNIQLVSESGNRGSRDLQSLLFQINKQISNIIQGSSYIISDPLANIKIRSADTDPHQTELLYTLRKQVFDALVDTAHSRRGINMMFHLIQKIKQYID